MNELRNRVIMFARSLTWHRRLLAAGLAAAGTAVAIEAASPEPPATTPVIVAAQAVPGGTVISREHLASAEVPPEIVPEGAVTRPDALGRMLAGPINAGEILTDTRIVGDRLLTGWGAGLVAVPVRFGDTAAAQLLRHGDRIDVLATRADGSGATDVVARAVPVLTVTTDESGTINSGGSLVIVGATDEQATAIAGATTMSQLSFALRPTER